MARHSHPLGMMCFDYNISYTRVTNWELKTAYKKTPVMGGNRISGWCHLIVFWNGHLLCTDSSAYYLGKISLLKNNFAVETNREN